MAEETKHENTDHPVQDGNSEEFKPDELEVVELDQRLEFGVAFMDDDLDCEHNDGCCNTNCDTNAQCC